MFGGSPTLHTISFFLFLISILFSSNEGADGGHQFGLRPWKSLQNSLRRVRQKIRKKNILAELSSAREILSYTTLDNEEDEALNSFIIAVAVWACQKRQKSNWNGVAKPQEHPMTTAQTTPTTPSAVGLKEGGIEPQSDVLDQHPIAMTASKQLQKTSSEEGKSEIGHFETDTSNVALMQIGEDNIFLETSVETTASAAHSEEVVEIVVISHFILPMEPMAHFTTAGMEEEIFVIPPSNGDTNTTAKADDEESFQNALPEPVQSRSMSGTLSSGTNEDESELQCGAANGLVSSVVIHLRGGATFSPEHLPKPYYPDPSIDIPQRFVLAAKGDPVGGHKRYLETLHWRQQERMETILMEQHPHFGTIKKYWPHYFHLRGLNNEPVYYEMPPKMNLPALRKAGVTVDDLLRHYAMVTEFMWTVIEPSEYGKSIYIIDLEGMKLWDFAGEVVAFVRKASVFTSRHYPERAGTIYVMNAPSFFSVIWNVIKPLVDPVTLEKVFVVRGKEQIRAALRERVPLDNIPPEYGGYSPPLGTAPEEKAMADLMVYNNFHRHQQQQEQNQQHWRRQEGQVYQ